MQVELDDFQVMELLQEKISDLKVDIEYNDNIGTWREQMANIKSLTRAVEIIVNKKLAEPGEE